ncbi:uncharacterized protein LOC135704263 [Ochlerotatus camptorhynchus]|uniref:uncharacterized protein LOC135704263 n=1 Tax=Ochlerotatus camptorhynchus TaxID=644619 RepID=UPI0031E33580
MGICTQSSDPTGFSPLVIQTLKMRYGRSELLIESLAERVRTAPSPKVDKLEMIIEFGTMVQALCDHIIAAHLYDHLANPTLLKDLVEKLPAEYRMRWAGHRRQQREVNLKTFSDFMEEIVSDAYSVSNVATTFERYSKQDRPKPRDRNLIHTEAGKVDCLVCKREGHRVKDCKIFSTLPVDDRWKKVQSLQLCRTCVSNHGRRACRSTKRCEVDGCQYRHNPLLHASASKYKGQTSESHVQYHFNEASIPSLLFRILPITLHNGLKSVKTFAFLDEGSSVTMIESSLAKELGVTGYKKPLCLKWTGDVTREELDSQRISILISGCGNSKRYRMNDVRTIQALDLPMQIPKLLIGVDNLRLAFPLKTREGVTGGPTAVKTRLGWCVYGGQRTQEHPEYSYHISECGGEEAFDEALKKYFSFEEAGIKSTGAVMSEEDKRCARILETTTKRVDERFESGLLWKYDNFEFPDSYPMAVKRLQCLESRMAKDPSLKQNILRQIDEYQQKGYAHRATTEELAETDPRRTWYLPPRSGDQPEQARESSINLGRVRKSGWHILKLGSTKRTRHAVSADVKEMFHQVRTRGADRSAQSFLFRDDPSEEPQVFRMDVATFGATCSPAIAQYVKNANARSFEKELPRAVEGIVFNHYVDDYLDSFSTENKAKQVASEVREIHKRGGFEIRNWCSNSPTVLQHLGESQQHPVKQMCLDEKEQSERVLGMRRDACAYVSYLRVVNEDGEVEVALVSAKTKVVPLKPVTIPRLELQACVLGTRLAKYIIDGHSYSIKKRYSPYIAYRVSEILEATDRTEWRWVASKDNPADEATKWGAGPYFNSNSIWYSGPEFLYLPERDWKRGDPEKSGEEELRACYVHREIRVPECIVDIERFSKWTHLQRVMAYVHRFTNNCRNVRLNTKVLTEKELKMAENSIFRLVQWQSFPDEIITLSTNRFLPSEQQRPLEKSSTIYQVTPMLDEFGVLRVNGRIAAAQCASTDAKYPIILPRKHRLAALLVDHYHRQLKHGNKETTVNEIRQRFHIPKLRSSVNFVTARCNLCMIRKARPSIPQMAPLPQARLSPFTRPFSYRAFVDSCAVEDFPLKSTAITAPTFKVQSDYYVSKSIPSLRLRSPVQQQLGDSFHPGAPHMGGAWERMVRSVKTALTAAYYNEKLDDDALHTMIVEAESIVNSRPLTYLPLDSVEQEVITPNHFLLGSSADVKQPVVQYEDNNALLKRSWAIIQERLNSF